MDILCNMEFFCLLIDNSNQVTKNQLAKAYGEFIEKTKMMNQPEVDYSIIFRTLSLTRIEFQSLQAQILYEQGEKCPKISLFAESHFCY